MARWVSEDALLKRPEMDWTVWKLIPKVGIGRIVGESGAGKTYHGLSLAYHVTREVPLWFGADIDE